ncbi:hypothetical protein HA402_008098 [Bradysia odoriphaga]|nr:hypothetical protein HA402_008098 [Bradysia odoriphaga]
MEPDTFNSNKNVNEDARPIKNSKLNDLIKKSLLLISTLAGVAIGVFVGISLRPFNLSSDSIMLITYPGELFLRLLKLVTLPMLIASLITVSASLNARMNGKLVSRTILYFASTSLLSAFCGICFAMLIKPGSVSITKVVTQDRFQKTSFLDSILDLGRNLFPDNLFQATFQQAATTYVPSKSNDSINPALVRELTQRNGVNSMGIVVFCLAFGTLLSTMGERGQVIKDFFSAVFEVTLKMVTAIIWLTGFAVASIIAGKILSVENLLEVFSQLTLFIVCVIVGLVFHQMVLLPSLYFIFLRKQPYTFLAKLTDPWITAFAASSSAVTLPTTLHCMNVKMNSDSRISNFVLTLGVTLNTNGTAMFLAVSTIFISRLDGADLTYSTLFTILLMATISSMSMPSVPSGSLVMLLVILTSIDVDGRDISLLFAVDWMLDRCRTTSNVIGDCFAAAVLEKFSKKDLIEMDSMSGVQQKSPESEILIQSV